MKTALITGGSSGIGLELAKVFAREGYDLVLIARGTEELQKAEEIIKSQEKYGSIQLLSKDLSLLGAAIEIFNELNEKNIQIDALVNNAGIGDFAAFKDANANKQSAMIELNVHALTTLTRLFLPQMIARKSGSILNTASTAAFFPGAYMSVYFATKAFVLSFSEALSEELRGSGVSVTALCPGATATHFEKTASAETSKLFRGNLASPTDVAEYGYRSMVSKKVVAIYGLSNKFGVFAGRFMPRFLIRHLIGIFQKPKPSQKRKRKQK